MKTVRILLVDDENDALQAMALGLRAPEREILTSDSRNKAIRLIKTEKPHIVVTDLKLVAMF